MRAVEIYDGRGRGWNDWERAMPGEAQSQRYASPDLKDLFV